MFPWTAIGSSSLPVRKLRLGDFNGDGTDDVLSVQAGRWAVSWSGTSSWERINASLGEDVSRVLIGDIDANGLDDIVRYRVEMVLPGNGSRPHRFRVRSEVSWDGRSGWTRLLDRNFDVPVTGVDELPSPVHVALMGRFRGPNVELLEVSGVDRKGRIWDAWTSRIVDHGRHAY